MAKHTNEATGDEAELLRRRLDVGGPRKRVLTPGDLKKAFGLADPYVASRVFAVLAGDKRTVSKDEALGRLLGVLLGGADTKLKFLFELHDVGNRGKLGPEDVKKMLDASLRQNEIKLTPHEKVGVVKALFERADQSKDGSLDLSEFRRLVKSRPEVLEGMVQGLDTWFLGAHRTGKMRFRGRRRFWGIVAFVFTTVPAVLWRFLLVAGYVALNAWLAWTAFDTYRQAGANVWIQIARAMGAILNLNGALVLVPMMRGLLGWIRRTPILSRLVPVDDHIDVHRLFGNVLFFGGLIHAGAHLMNYLTLPTPLADSLFKTVAGLTGVIVLFILLLIWFLARNFIRRSGRFELFFFSHTLYGVWFVTMLIHAPHFWFWAGIPLALYIVEWLVQRTRKRHASVVVKAKVLPGAVTELHLKRPENFHYQPGDYLYLRVPAVSRFEWHPFTISSPPEEKSTVSVHIRSTGNWTKALAKLFGEKLQGKDKLVPVALGGPYGTPSNRIFKTHHVVLVGAGIGVTPFASILRSLLARQQSGEKTKVQTVRFVWLNRGQASFDWFGDLLSEIEAQGPKGFFDLRIFLTNASVSPSGGLARIGMDLIYKESRRDLTTGLKSRTQFGRPDWDTLFEEFSAKRGAGSASVFFCGPAPLGAEVRAAARHYGFRFRKENF